MSEEKSCLLEKERPLFKKMLESKIRMLQDEIALEEEFYKENGLFHNRDIGEIEEEIELVKKVMKNIDKLPVCNQ